MPISSVNTQSISPSSKTISSSLFSTASPPKCSKTLPSPNENDSSLCQPLKSLISNLSPSKKCKKENKEAFNRYCSATGKMKQKEKKSEDHPADTDPTLPKDTAKAQLTIMRIKKR
jgi:hypothetical protein